MADKTHIEWSDATWNPLVGCTKVSPGCDNCYAEGVVNRWNAAGKPAFPARFDTVSLRGEAFLTQPLRWTKPRRVFVNSLADLFHADVPDEFIAQVFAVMSTARQHTFQLLTKRHGRMRTLLSSGDFRPAVAAAAGRLVEDGDAAHDYVLFGPAWPLPNVWLGVSVEDQHWADIRIPALLGTPAAVRWVSAEPLLGPINLRLLASHGELTGQELNDGGAEASYVVRRPGLDWVVTGGESGPRARPMHPGWARDLRDQCDRAGVAYLHKQNGAYIPDQAGGWTAVDSEGREYPGRLRHVGKAAAGRDLDGRTYDGYPRAFVGAR